MPPTVPKFRKAMKKYDKRFVVISSFDPMNEDPIQSGLAMKPMLLPTFLHCYSFRFNKISDAGSLSTVSANFILGFVILSTDFDGCGSSSIFGNDHVHYFWWPWWWEWTRRPSSRPRKFFDQEIVLIFNLEYILYKKMDT